MNSNSNQDCGFSGCNSDTVNKKHNMAEQMQRDCGFCIYRKSHPEKDLSKHGSIWAEFKMCNIKPIYQEVQNSKLRLNIWSISASSSEHLCNSATGNMPDLKQSHWDSWTACESVKHCMVFNFHSSEALTKRCASSIRELVSQKKSMLRLFA